VSTEKMVKESNTATYYADRLLWYLA
jgi:hypothetical protein